MKRLIGAVADIREAWGGGQSPPIMSNSRKYNGSQEITMNKAQSSGLRLLFLALAYSDWTRESRATNSSGIQA